MALHNDHNLKSIQVHFAQNMAQQHDEQINVLLRDIVGAQEGMQCFLCVTTIGRECIWDEIGEEMLREGNGIIDFYQRSRMPTTLARMHWAARYHLYCHYTFAISSDWGPGMGCIRLPACIEQHIRMAYPGNGNFVGFQERRGGEGA